MLNKSPYGESTVIELRREKGFTLIELMIVVAIVALLAALAYFNYSKYAFRARRADGKEALTRIAAAEERYYTTRNVYVSDLTALGYTTATVQSEKTYYTITATTSNANQAFSLSAAPQGAQAKDACGSLTLDNGNVRAPTTSSNGDCW